MCNLQILIFIDICSIKPNLLPIIRPNAGDYCICKPQQIVSLQVNLTCYLLLIFLRVKPTCYLLLTVIQNGACKLYVPVINPTEYRRTF